MGGDAKTTQDTRVTVPRWMRPITGAAVGAQGQALTSLQDQLQPGTSLVAGFNPIQQQAQQQAIDLAGGAGGFIPTAQQTLLDTAQGNYLAGGPGFNEAVQASIRAAQPNILSSFGAAGRGVSGLGQSAIQQVASDAFAGLFDKERARQLNAATLLPQIGMAGTNILQQVGGQQQQQAQRELEGPVQAMERLLAAGAGALPLSNLFGSSTTTSQSGNTIGQILGGITSAAGLASGAGGGKAAGYNPATAAQAYAQPNPWFS